VLSCCISDNYTVHPHKLAVENHVASKQHQKYHVNRGAYYPEKTNSKLLIIDG